MVLKVCVCFKAVYPLLKIVKIKIVKNDKANKIDKIPYTLSLFSFACLLLNPFFMISS